MSLYNNIPESLRILRQWVCWRITIRDSKRTKVPLNPRTLKAASSTDPADWTSFDEAVAASTQAGVTGIGFVFVDGITGIDLDGCFDDANNLHDDAAKLLARFASTYCEVTPSLKGIHVIARGRKPNDAKCKAVDVHGCKQIEIYDTGRYFTFTGNRAGAAVELTDCEPEVMKLCRELWPAKAPTPALPAMPLLPPAASGAMNKARYMGYLKTIPEAVSGQGGHEKTLRAACDGYRFGLGDADVWDGLLWFNANKCPADDRWTEGELKHKLESGRDKCGPGRPEFGIKLTEERTPLHRPPGVPAAGATTQQPDQVLIPLGTRDPEDGKWVLSPKKTLPTSLAYCEEYHTHKDASGQSHRSMVSYADQFYHWHGNYYRDVEDASIRSTLQSWLHNAKHYVYNKKTEQLELRQFESNDGSIRNALHSLHDLCHLTSTFVPPVWLNASTDDFNPSELLVGKSSTLHIPTGTIIPPTPQLFATSALDFDYDANASSPVEWLKFLHKLWPNDPESIATLQDWFGYVLTQDTRQQKMLLIVGPRRSGKGTIARVLQNMIGKANVAGPTISSLSTQFGLQPLIGKSLAIVSDARFSGEHIATVTERLLCISGEDSLSIDRKFKESVTIRLPTRFMFLTNELPKLTDASGALAGRFVFLRLVNSFYGKEDNELQTKLTSELPGILLWAIEGWERLRQRGMFVQPSSVGDVIQDMEDLSSPVGAFVRECCNVGDGHRMWCDELYLAWQSWCDRDGRTVKTTKQTFGRDLSSAFPGITRKRSTQMHSFYEGIAVK